MMDWEKLGGVNLGQLERDETLLESVYEFLEATDFPEEDAAAAQPGQLVRILSVVQKVAKVKGEEARVGMEELVAWQQQLEEGKRGVAPSPIAANELRVMKQVNEDLKMELGELKRRLEHERGETDRLSAEAAAERARCRKFEREIDQLKTDLDEYRKHMQSQQGVGGVAVGGASLLRAGEREYRERLRQKDIEIASQLDKIEDLLNVRDEMEKQREELVGELGRVEEEKIACIEQSEGDRRALVEADVRCREVETARQLLEGQVTDLRGCLEEKALYEKEIHKQFTEQTNQWQSAVEEKEKEILICREELDQLKSQLTEVAKDTNRANVIRLKKQLQDRDQEVAELQEEMARGAEALELLSSQLEEERLRTNPVLLNSTLNKDMEDMRRERDGLKQALDQEMERRRASDTAAIEKEAQLTEALNRIGLFERGEYGLYEAIQEIKTRKEEIAVRDRDIIELTRDVNHLNESVNRLSEFNKMLCERLGIEEGEVEETAMAAWRSKREGEREQLTKRNQSLQNEVERLEEEKLGLRKQLVELRGTSAYTENSILGGGVGGGGGGGGGGSGGGGGGGGGGGRDETDDSANPKLLINQLQIQVAELEEECVRMRREKDTLASQLSRLQQQPSLERETERERREEGEERRREGERRGRVKRGGSGFHSIPLPDDIPMTSRDIISSLNEHLLQVVEAEKEQTQKCNQLTAQLGRYQQKFSVAIHQQGLLYKEYVEKKSVWEREKRDFEVRNSEINNLKQFQASLTTQLSRVHAELERKSQIITDLSREAARTEEQAIVFERLLTETQRHLSEREREMDAMRREAREAAERKSEEREERERFRGELLAAERKIFVTNENNQQLQALVVQKEKHCERYCQLLQEARSDLRSMTQKHEIQLTSLVKKSHEYSDSAVRRLRDEVAVATDTSVSTTTTAAKELARLRELEDMIGQQRVSYEARLAEERRERELVRQEYETSLVRARQEIGENNSKYFIEIQELKNELATKSSRMLELQQELQMVSEELAGVQSSTQSKTTQTLIMKLKEQLLVKEKQQQTLNAALRQVRTELLDATQKAILNHGHTHSGVVNKVKGQTDEAAAANVERRVAEKTRYFESRIEGLTSELNGMRTELERTRDREAAARLEVGETRDKLNRLQSVKEKKEEEEEREGERLKKERDEGRERVRRLESEIHQYKKSLEQMKNKEQKMANEIQTLLQKLDHKPEVEELEKRLRVLQSRFDRQKHQFDSLRQQQQQQQTVHVAVTSSTPANRHPSSPHPPHPHPPHPPPPPSSLVSIRHSSPAVLSWEETKKWQKKLDTLRTKLADKTIEAESKKAQVASLRETVDRGDREKRLLQDRVTTLQKKIISNLDKSNPTGSHGNGKTGNRGDLHKDHTPSSEELQRVITAMRTVVENLQRENEKLKKEALIRTRDAGNKTALGDDVRGQSKKKKEKEEDLVVEGKGGSGGQVSDAQDSPSPPPPPSRVVAKLAAENEKLQKTLKREMDKNSQLLMSQKSIAMERDKLRNELKEMQEKMNHTIIASRQQLTSSSSSAAARGPPRDQEMEELRAEVEKKTAMLMEVKRHLKEVAESEKEREEKQEMVAKERDALREQVERLRSELESLDPSFFEELEDLKFNYQEALKKIQQYEVQVASMAQQLGVSPPSISS